MKELYSSKVNKKVQKEVIEETKDGKLTKTVETVEPVKVILKKPSRSDIERAEELFAVEYGKYVRAGMLTNQLVEKMYENSEAFISKQDGEYLSKLQRSYDLQSSYQELKAKESQSPEDLEAIQEILKEWVSLQNQLQDLQSVKTSLFQNTADTKARDKTITWLTLALTHVQEGSGAAKAFFKGSTDEEKYKSYDDYAEKEDAFFNEVINKAILYTSLWYLGKAQSFEDFEEYRKTIEPEAGGEDEADKQEAEVA